MTTPQRHLWWCCVVLLHNRGIADLITNVMTRLVLWLWSCVIWLVYRLGLGRRVPGWYLIYEFQTMQRLTSLSHISHLKRNRVRKGTGCVSTPHPDKMGAILSGALLHNLHHASPSELVWVFWLAYNRVGNSSSYSSKMPAIVCVRQDANSVSLQKHPLALNFLSFDLLAFPAIVSFLLPPLASLLGTFAVSSWLNGRVLKIELDTELFREPKRFLITMILGPIFYYYYYHYYHYFHYYYHYHIIFIIIMITVFLLLSFSLSFFLFPFFIQISCNISAKFTTSPKNVWSTPKYTRTPFFVGLQVWNVISN